MLLQPQTQAMLARERSLLADAQAYLTARGAPFDVLSLAQTALSSLDETFLVVVVGEFNAGKSSFLNALLGTDLLEEGVTPTTDRIYVLVHGEKAGTLETLSGANRFGPRSQSVEPTDDPFVVRLQVSSAQLEGLALVDTPGTNAVIRRHQALTEGFLPRADLLLFLTSAERPFTESERQFLTLAKRWGRSVLMVVNKADLLSDAFQQAEVRAFVEKHARETLGLSPPVFLVSSRLERAGGDPGFKALREDLERRLNERERTRMKLENPLNIASELLSGERERVRGARDVLSEDFKLLEGLEGGQTLHAQDMGVELAAQRAKVDAVLDAFRSRARAFIEDRMRIQKVGALLKTKELEADFEREAVADLPARLSDALSGAVDRLLERNLRFWEDTQAALRKRQDVPLPETRFALDRQALFQGLSLEAEKKIEGFTRDDFARDFAQGAQNAAVTGGLTAAGGIGLGALTVALVSSAAIDITGITAGLTLVGVGALVLPARRRAAIAKIEKSVEETRAALHALLEREYAREGERFAARLTDTLSPWTRFIRLERDKLLQAEEGARALEQRVAELRAELGRLAS